MRNIKMIVEYDGTDYSGWQRQDDRPTVQRVLEDSIGVITGEKITVFGSGRTDAGVHALNQVAHFKTRSRIAPRNLLKGINSLLPPDVAVKDLTEAPGDFHARYGVKSKVYLYQIYNKPVRSALFRKYAWFISNPLDVENMRQAASCLEGTHDFSSFCAADAAVTDRTRTVMEASVEHKKNGMIQLRIEADGFLKYMVRNISGTLAEVGRGKRSPEEFKEVLQSKDRRKAGITAPPQGLFLMEVKY
jgi:tRNA pseudouridine38-40 synthase